MIYNVRLNNLLKMTGTNYQSFINKHILFMMKIPDELTHVNNVTIDNLNSLANTYLIDDENYPFFKALNSTFWNNPESFFLLSGEKAYLLKVVDGSNSYLLVLGKINSIGNPVNIGLAKEIFLTFDLEFDYAPNQITLEHLKLEAKPTSVLCENVTSLINSGQIIIEF